MAPERRGCRQSRSGRCSKRRQVSAGAEETECQTLRAALEGRDAGTFAEETLEKRGAGAEQSRSRPSRVAPSVAMQATPPCVRLPLRSPPSAHLRPDQGDRERGARSEPGTSSSEGSYNFRRVAIRRKSNVSYLPPGIPRPWSRPSSPLRWVETATFRAQAPADAPGKCLGRKGVDGGVGAGEGRAECSAGAPDRLREPAGEIFPEGCAWPPTLLRILSLPPKDLAWPGTRLGLSLPWR